MSPRDLWEKSVGWLPHKVTVYEREDRGGELYLRWRADGNWRRKSLRRSLRTTRGRIDPDVQKWALEQASAHYAQLVAGLPPSERPPAAPLTIGATLARAINPETGKYPADTPHRREVERALAEAVRVWGADTPWADIRKSDMRKLWRARINGLSAKGLTGARGAEVTAARVFAVAQWLRDEEVIPPGACEADREHGRAARRASAVQARRVPRTHEGCECRRSAVRPADGVRC
jgi:hypothetical protein